MLGDRAPLADARHAFEAGDWNSAFALFGRAREEDELEPDDLSRMAESAWWLGHVPESLTISEEAYRRYGVRGLESEAASTALRLSLLWFTRGDWTVGTAWLSRAKRLLETIPMGPVHAYFIYLDTSFALLDGGELWSQESVEKLAELARRFPDPAVEALSLVTAGMAEVRRGSTRRGFALLNEAMLPVLANSIPPVWAGDIYCTTIHVCHELADLRRMEDWTKATERWCEQFGSEAIYTGICRIHRLEILSARGEWAHVEDRITHESRDLAGGNGWVAGEGFYQLGEIRRLRGDGVGAQEAFDLARQSGIDPQPGAALLALREGRGKHAWAMIMSSLAERDRVGRVRLLRAAVEIALAVGEESEAIALADELRDAAEHFGSPGFRAWSLHADGMVSLAREDEDATMRHLRAAAAAFRDDRQPYECACVLLLIAAGHDRWGMPDQAVLARDQARETFLALGAEPPSETAVVRQAGPLTPRESEVLSSVAEGLSNREVGSRLFISEKTVGRHLANIYTKIGVGTRTAAAAWWRERHH